MKGFAMGRNSVLLVPLVLVAHAVVAIGIAATAHGATVYKWIDSRGVVNYTSAPPPEARGVVAINTAPALDNRAGADDEEARYWRERRQREARREDRDAVDARTRRETEELRQAQMRQDLALRAQAASAEQQTLRLLREHCERQRRIDCDSQGGGAYAPYYPPVVVVRHAPQPFRRATSFSTMSNPLGIRPGTIAGNATAFARPDSGVVASPGYSMRAR